VQALRQEKMSDNNYWIINGEAYDLSKFKHPAGPIALECGKGRDCTGLFLSYHPFSDKPQQILNKYKIKKPENAEEQNEFDFSKKSQFFEELNKEVQEKVFKNKTHYATLERWLHIAVMGIIAASLCPFYFMGHYWASIAFPLALWVFIANTFHDAAHFALSKNWKINWLFSYTAPVYTSPFTWYHQHVIGHHIYTNIHKKDIQICIMEPIYGDLIQIQDGTNGINTNCITCGSSGAIWQCQWHF
jgi:hypothetical protein